jgi:hypothetical protein
MLPSLAVRTSGALLIAAGALIAVAFVLVEFVYEPLFYLFGLVALLMLLGLPALQARLRTLAARIGLWLAVVSLAVLTIMFAVVGLLEAVTGFDPDESDAIGVVLIGSFFGLVAGLALLGIASAVERTLPVVPAVILTISLPVGLLVDIVVNGDDTSVGAWLAFGGLAIALAWIGYALWSQRARTEPDRAPLA